jgi:hypothetical protein
MAAYDQGDGSPRCKTKKELKELCKESPEKVLLNSTSAFGNGFSGFATELPEGTTFTVVGPDPFRDRRWYANVVRKNGVVKVS